MYVQLTSAGAASGHTPPTAGVAEEEHRITDLQNRLVELRNQVRLIIHIQNPLDPQHSQKDAILRSNEPKPASKPKAASKPVPKPPLSPSPESENHEDVFWSTPAASARTLRFTDRLLEEEPDFAELSKLSFDSPGPAPPKSVFARLAAGGSPTDKGLRTPSEGNVSSRPRLHEGEDEEVEEELHDQSSLLEARFDPQRDPETSSPGAEEDLDEESTIILPKVPLSAPGNTLPSPSVVSQLQTLPLAEAQSSTDASLKLTKVCVTPELESIVASVILFISFLPCLLKRTVGSDMEYRR